MLSRSSRRNHIKLFHLQLPTSLRRMPFCVSFARHRLPLKQHLLSAIEANKGLITCVLFMGGDDEKQIDELRDCIEICHREKLKVALYTGSDKFPSELSTSLDYIKYGHYDKSRGGLTSRNTNQKFYKKNNGEWVDITYRFWKTPKEQYED